jgi:hypothetical protein
MDYPKLPYQLQEQFLLYIPDKTVEKMIEENVETELIAEVLHHDRARERFFGALYEIKLIGSFRQSIYVKAFTAERAFKRFLASHDAKEIIQGYYLDYPHSTAMKGQEVSRPKFHVYRMCDFEDKDQNDDHTFELPKNLR